MAPKKSAAGKSCRRQSLYAIITGEMTIGFMTFGCRLNRAESLDLEAQYAAAGWEIAHLPSTSESDPLQRTVPDAIIVRGCSVTAKAQRDCEKKIAHLRNRFPDAEVLIVGCHPDAKPIPPHLAPPPLPDADAPINRQLSRAYLKVQDGCSGKCAFCIVPTFRGAPVSVPFERALARARACLDAGFREIIVTGCNLCLYRDAGRRLPELVSALAEIESPGHRVRLGSIEPGLCDSGLVDAMESHPNICRFLHLSLQSGSNRILRLMRRPYTTEHVAAFCADALNRLGPRLSIGADIITGFPGETEADFNETKSFLTHTPSSSPFTLHSSPFTSLHIFPYSEREGTEAATMRPVVPVDIRRARAKELEAVAAANQEAFARSLIGREVTVCVERDGNGRTGEYMRCLLKGAAPRRSLVHAVVDDYFPKLRALSATIRAKK